MFNHLHRSLLLLLLTATSLLAAPIPLVVDLSGAGISLHLEATPPAVTPATDLLLTLTLEHPDHLQVKLPHLLERFTGFTRAEDFATDPIEVAGQRRQTFRWKLEPEPGAERYRLAPFAVEVTDMRLTPPARTTYATPPVLFPAEPLAITATGAAEVTLKPLWIRPTIRSIMLWIFLSIVSAALIAALLYLLLRISRHVREIRLSPVERAWAELDRLLKRRLPEQGLFKEFYIELTFVVRRYIERTHGIRAPRQTTEEFLLSAASHKDFPQEALPQLKTFLESSDMVKFAGVQATTAMAEDATTKARHYLTHDSTTQTPSSH